MINTTIKISEGFILESQIVNNIKFRRKASEKLVWSADISIETPFHFLELLEQRIADLEAENAKIKEEYDDLESEYLEIKDDNASLETEKNELKGGNAELKNEMRN
ncbi:uncharacterized protein OCT59_023401 [Rhizophagus irregularis]|uniref:uncharacterized protein n=1 Tax=Rhizophagus irregularis TaxID=588596 RepID=UPI00332C4CEA|nr:hypothetical protein OCT59_023401 [Rhizophagus irregularis]